MGRAYCAKQTQLPDAGHGGGVSIADCGFRTDLRRDGPCDLPAQGSITRNKPNLPAGQAGAAVAGADHAKRSQKAVVGSQWPVGGCTNKPNFRRSFRFEVSSVEAL